MSDNSNLEQYLSKLNTEIAGLMTIFNEIDQASLIIASGIKEDRLVHIFGTEALAASSISDVFFRAGSLINFNPILDPILDPAHGAYRNAMCMNIGNLAHCILDYYENIVSGDTIIIIGSDANLPMFKDAIEWAKAKALRIIVLICCCKEEVDADVIIPIGTDLSSTTYLALVSTILNLIVTKTQSYLDNPGVAVWDGIRFVDLEKNQEKIDKVLFRVRHI